MERQELLSFLDAYLNVDHFQDYGKNGLQVHGSPTVQRIVSGVTFSRRLIDEAILHKAELILVHHGLFKGDIPDPPCFHGPLRDRLALLFAYNLNLAAYHLPLDAHPDVGNNALACKKLGLNDLHPLDVGFIGHLSRPESLKSFIRKVETLYGRQVLALEFGPTRIQRVAIISGGSSTLWETALQAEADLFICGDMKESLVRKIEEMNFNVLAAGHYHTEILGIKALSELIREKFPIEVSFIDIPSPV
ncbi:MAG: Nif3-like dinuclear metal center hexameric protein [bacterium]